MQKRLNHVWNILRYYVAKSKERQRQTWDGLLRVVGYPDRLEVQRAMQKKHGKEKYQDSSDRRPPSVEPPQQSTATGSRNPMPEKRHATDAHLRSSDWTKFGLLERIEYNAKRLKQTPPEVPWRADRQPMP
eukprot:3762623-Amphidinium_carterae.1